MEKEKIYGNVDGLTNLYNENYLKRHYSDYTKACKNANFIMFDFKKFKHINDTYGHDMGDRYLILFSRVLSSVFTDSLVIRLHGDEFCVLTKFSIDEIVKRLELCNKKIDIIKVAANIPEKFEFNAGIVPAEHSIQKTKAKADYMMYYAKKNEQNYQIFSEDIWKIKAAEDDFISDIENDIDKEKLTYFKRNMFDIKSNSDIALPSGIWDVSTRNSSGQSILSDKYYQMLRENSILQKIDMYNLEYLLPFVNKLVSGKTIINLDYKSLLNKNNIIEYLDIMFTISGVEPKNIVLSINIDNMEEQFYGAVIDTLVALKRLGFEICLDKYNSRLSDVIWENTDIDYLKLDYNYWKNTISNPRSEALLAVKLKLFSEYSNLVPIFTCISDKEEYDHVLGFRNSMGTDKAILVSGDYLEPESKIKLKKHR